MKLFKFAMLAAAPLLFSNCKDVEAKGDVTFARSTFESLAKGETSVIPKIDWETFNSSGTPVGAQYIALPNDSEKESYRNSFVTQFAASFRDSGGKLEDFTNWRLTDHDEISTEVTADSPTGLLKLTVSERNNEERLSAIQIVK